MSGSHGINKVLHSIKQIQIYLNNQTIFVLGEMEWGRD